MTSNITKSHAPQCEGETLPSFSMIGSIERAVRERARELFKELIRSKLDAALARSRYERSNKAGREEKVGITGIGTAAGPCSPSSRPPAGCR